MSIKNKLFKKIEPKYVLQFQFDNDEPGEFMELSEPECIFSLPKEGADMIFTSESGKKFRLFITKV